MNSDMPLETPQLNTDLRPSHLPPQYSWTTVTLWHGSNNIQLLLNTYRNEKSPKKKLQQTDKPLIFNIPFITNKFYKDVQQILHKTTYQPVWWTNVVLHSYNFHLHMTNQNPHIYLKPVVLLPFVYNPMSSILPPANYATRHTSEWKLDTYTTAHANTSTR